MTNSLNPVGLRGYDSIGLPADADPFNVNDYAQSVNRSGLAPLGRAILVEPFEPERRASVIALPDSVLRNERVLDVKVRVVELGPECYPDEKARCTPGDVVFVAKMSGFVAQGPRDGRMYRLVNDRDVFAKVTFFGEADHA